MKEKFIRSLSTVGLMLLTGCGAPTEQQVKKIDLGGIEISQTSPHSYRVSTLLSWNWQTEPAWEKAENFLRDRCVIEYVEKGLVGSKLFVVENPNCVIELR